MLIFFVFIVFSLLFVVLLQSIIWRISFLHPSLYTLLTLLTIPPFLLIIAILFLNIHLPLSLLEWIIGSFYYAAACLCYLITFTGIESDSPTLSLIIRLNYCGKMSKEELISFFEEDPVVQKRFNSMIKHGFLLQQEENILLSRKPFLIFRIILWYRKAILGITNFGG